MRIGFTVFIALIAVAATAAGIWHFGFRDGREVAAPAGSTVEPPDASASTAQQTTVDLSNPPPEIRVASEIHAPAPIVVNEPAIRGRVIDEFDMPVADAAVTVYNVDLGPHRTFTDASGAFAIGDLRASDRYRVSAVKARYNEAVTEDVAAATSDLVLVLTGTSTAVGRVVDESGNPVGRFELVYLNYAAEDDALWKEIVRSGATSWHGFEDAQGRYEVTGVASEAPFSLGARAEGFEAARRIAPAAPPGQQVSIADIVLKTEARIDGLVLSPARAPVSGADIHLGRDADGPIVGRSDRSGRFSLAGLGEEPIELTAVHDAYLPETIRTSPRRSETTAVEIVLGQGGAVVGRVTRGNQAAPGQTVLATRLIEPRVQKQAVTDADGRYRIEGLGTGMLDVLAKVAIPGGGSTLRIQSQAQIVAGADTTLDFAFPETLGTLEGRVTASGRPVDLAEIKGTVNTSQGQVAFTTTAREDGFFRVESIIPGDASITVTARANDAELRRTVTTQVRGGDVTWVAVDFDEAAVVSGRVTNIAASEVGQVFALAGHEPVDVSTVEAVLRLESSKAGESDIDEGGNFIINGLEPGDYTLVALVFLGDADTGDDAINTIRVGTGKTTLPESGSISVNLALSP